MQTATSLICGAIQRLEMVNAIPSNIVSILLDIYQSTSYQDFNEIFRTMKIALKIQPNSTYKISDTKIAETNFQELYKIGVWQKAEHDTVFINNSRNQGNNNNNNNNGNYDNGNGGNNSGKGQRKGKKGKGKRGRKNNHPKYIPPGPGKPTTKV